MKKVIFSTDFSPASENAFSYLMELNEDQPGFAIKLINVVIPQMEMAEAAAASTMMLRGNIDIAEKACKDFIEKSLIQFQSTHNIDEQPEIDSKVEIGLPVSAITEYAVKQKADLIVMGTQGQHSRWNRFIGSITAAVIENTKVPIFAIPNQAKYQGWKNATVAIDLKQSDPWQLFKALQIVGKKLDHLDIVHFYPEDKISKTEIEMSELETYFEKFPQSFSTSYHSLKGSKLTPTIKAFLTSNNSEMLILLGPHSSGFRKLFFQSASKELFYKTDLPLLVMP